MDQKDQLIKDLVELEKVIGAGWCRRTFCQWNSGQAQYCLIGGINAVTLGNNAETRSRKVMESVANYLQVEIGVRSLTYFNDIVAVDKEDVLNVIRGVREGVKNNI